MSRSFSAALVALALTASAAVAQQPARPAAPVPRTTPARKPAAKPAPRPATEAAAPVARPVAGPVKRVPMFLVARADSVFIFIDSLAPRGYMWRVTRGDGTLVADSIQAERSPERATDRLGADLPFARRLTRAEDDFALLRRLMYERTVAYTGLLLSRRIAEVTGRLAVDPSPGRAGATYRAEMVRTVDGAVVATLSATLAAAPTTAAAPTGLKAIAALEGMVVTWQYPAYTGNPGDVTVAFLVERAGADSTWALLPGDPVVRADGSTLAFVDNDVADRASYRYRVRPMLIGGFLTAPSAAVTGTMRDQLPPLAPLYAAADVQDGRVRIMWAMPPDADVAFYQVERRRGGADSTWLRVSPRAIPSDTLVFVDSTVTGGEIYAWRVRAFDEAGNAGAWCTPVTARAYESVKPDAPKAVTATLGKGRWATYRWQKPLAKDVVGYHIWRGPKDGPVIKLTGVPVEATSFTDSAAAGEGLMPGVTYRIEIAAVDGSSNESERAVATLVVPDDDPPEAPRSVSATGRFGGSVTVTWTRSPALDVASYEVTVSPATAATPAPGRTTAARAGATPAKPRVLATIGPRGPFVVVDTAAPDNVALQYAVTAVDSAGNRSVAGVDSLRKVDEDRPSAPRLVQAVRTGGTVRLTWERVVSRTLAGYVILRASSLGGKLEEVGRTAVGVTEWVDRAPPATTYYAVRAVDQSGNTSIPQPLVTPVGGRP